MREIAADIRRWRQEGRPVAVATVAQVRGSGLRPLGAKFACTASGEISGSVSGGCIEGAVYEEAQEVLAGGPARLLEYGVSDETAWDVGLACGGSVKVWLEPLDAAVHDRLTACLDGGDLVAQSTVVAGRATAGGRILAWPDGRIEGSTGTPALDEKVVAFTVTRLAIGETGRTELQVAGERVEVLTEVFAPPPSLIVVGAVHIAIPLVTMANALDFRTIVLDARSAFATRERFPHAAELIVRWPAKALAQLGIDRSTFVAVMTHDDKIDVPALQVAVTSRARYIGVLGSANHHAQRVAQLKGLGVSDAELARIHAPIGLRLGAVGPGEIAVAVLAQMVAVRHGRDDSPASPRP